MTAPGGHRDVADVSVGAIVGDVSRDLSTLMRQELALAKAEVRVEVSKAAKGAGMLGGAGVAGWFFLLFLGNALWWALENVMDAGLAALITAVVWGLIAGVLALLGRNRLKTVDPKPERTIETVQKLPDAMKGNAS
ncbi:phage holin family protein [Jatrophihabitans sp. YIM 134969]